MKSELTLLPGVHFIDDFDTFQILFCSDQNFNEMIATSFSTWQLWKNLVIWLLEMELQWN